MLYLSIFLALKKLSYAEMMHEGNSFCILWFSQTSGTVKSVRLYQRFGVAL